MDKLLAIFSKYPWVACVILTHWLATAVLLLSGSSNLDLNLVLGLSLIATMIYAYFGFKIPKD